MTTILRLLIGFICGVAATGPMSAIMIAIHRRLPERERYPLPPREVTTKALDHVVGARAVDPSTRTALTWLAHFGYGGAAGAMYAQVHPAHSRPVAPRCILFGLLVWSISYLGLLPGLRVLRSATEQPARRNALMIVAHLAWGMVLAGLYEIFLSDITAENAAFDASTQPHRDRA